MLGTESTDEDATTASLNADLFDPVAGTMLKILLKLEGVLTLEFPAYCD